MHPSFEKVLVADDDLPWEVVDEKIKRKVMSYTNELMLVKVAFKQGGIGTIHQHSHLQISYVASGVFEVTIGDQTRNLKGGDVYFVPSNVLHGAVCLEEGLLVDVFNPMREDFV
ncbi:cupin domain-containing protein [Runella rosea]|uniref:Cupin domain-containing protein n=1 Tax=Runella rosea TaxID=2259595 RepID=A0A344TMG4_9BACT|nr:cupin domain-containing protein [Runella rosea]AXE19835.1 cupin domain-containing protein [Runella rosea]